MENRKHTSLKDLAQALGVSIPTVSRALKDSPEISRELCAKAKALAKEMNYRPNPFAMSLRKNAPRIIGVVVPDIVTHFFASILNGIENMAIANGYFVIITTSHESYEHEKRNIENLVNMRVEGIIACLSQETTDFSHISALKDININSNAAPAIANRIMAVPRSLPLTTNSNARPSHAINLRYAL